LPLSAAMASPAVAALGLSPPEALAPADKADGTQPQRGLTATEAVTHPPPPQSLSAAPLFPLLSILSSADPAVCIAQTAQHVLNKELDHAMEEPLKAKAVTASSVPAAAGAASSPPTAALALSSNYPMPVCVFPLVLGGGVQPPSLRCTAPPLIHCTACYTTLCIEHDNIWHSALEGNSSSSHSGSSGSGSAASQALAHDRCLEPHAAPLQSARRYAEQVRSSRLELSGAWEEWKSFEEERALEAIQRAHTITQCRSINAHSLTPQQQSALELQLDAERCTAHEIWRVMQAKEQARGAAVLADAARLLHSVNTADAEVQAAAGAGDEDAVSAHSSVPELPPALLKSAIMQPLLAESPELAHVLASFICAPPSSTADCAPGQSASPQLAQLGRARLLYRASEHGYSAAAFWTRCEGKWNTLLLVHVKPSDAPGCTAAERLGHVFGAYTPVAWPTHSVGSVGDPSGRTCIFSLRNDMGSKHGSSSGTRHAHAHGGVEGSDSMDTDADAGTDPGPGSRPFRLVPKRGMEGGGVFRRTGSGPAFGFGGGLLMDLKLNVGNRDSDQPDGCACAAVHFQLDEAADERAGLPPLEADEKLRYTKSSLAGACGGRGDHRHVLFGAQEVECFLLA